ncbi:hypothetical protein [Stenotrophomonas sp. 2YAF22]|uniref:hypothetical protein n=1 Tax=Stenotrophomonas sp. 2YAF22 TaxID=3233028 RepID=UPI003F9920F0
MAGPGRTYLYGQELTAIVAPLRAAGCEVVVEGADESHRMAGATLGIAWAGTGAERSAALGCQVDSLVLIGDEGRAAELAAWTLQAATLGWQVHPAAFAMMGAPSGVVILALSRAGVTVTGGGVEPQASYHGLAAALVRPGDDVIATDAAGHGLWRIVQQQSRCRWLGVVAKSLSALPQEPGMEWLEPSEWPRHAQPVDTLITQLPGDPLGLEPWLQHVQAALVRSGRMVVAIPLHDGRTVPTGALVAAMERQGLVIDRAWWQTFSRPAGLPQFAETARDAAGHLTLDPEASRTADALILMAVKVGGPGVVGDPSLLAPNIIAFQRDYLDASLVRLIVSMGLRLESAGLRRQLARKALLDCPESSADYGAALCVLLYDADEMRNHRRSELLAAAMCYMDAPAANPTVLRWQISLGFAAATLHQADGELSLAADCYSRVLGFDVLQFSPLLGTKTTAAAVRLGWIRFGQGDLAAARSAWARGLDEARRLSAQSAWEEVVGDADAPETFALPEFAAVMDEAGCLASALRLTAEVPLRPGVAWQWSNRSWRAQLQELRGQLQHTQLWQGQLQEAKDWLDSQYHLLTAELERCQQGRDALASQKHALDSELVGVRAAFHLSHQHAMAESLALHQQLRDVQAENADLLDIQARQQMAHAQLEASARMLAAATGVVMGTTPQPRLPAESLAEEMFRLADALERLPLKRMVRTMLRALTSLLGRR